MSDSFQPHESQHARPPYPSPTPGVHPNSCASSQWCHPAISSSVIPFSCPQSLPASGSFPMSQFFAPGGQSIVVSASTSVLPMNTQDWSPLGWTSWISLQSKDSQESSTPQFKSINSSALSFLYGPTLWTLYGPWGCKELDMTEQLNWTQKPSFWPHVLHCECAFQFTASLLSPSFSTWPVSCIHSSFVVFLWPLTPCSFVLIFWGLWIFLKISGNSKMTHISHIR